MANLITFKQQVGFQVIALMTMSLSSACFIAMAKPFESRGSNRIELFNECTLLLMSTLLCLFTDYVWDPDMQFMFGWLALAVMVVNIFCNIGYSLACSVLGWIRSLRRQYRAWMAKKSQSVNKVLDLPLAETKDSESESEERVGNLGSREGRTKVNRSKRVY